jgi:glc operon protein GlcG
LINAGEYLVVLGCLRAPGRFLAHHHHKHEYRRLPMYMHRHAAAAALAAGLAFASFGASAQVPSYGPSINLEQAKRAIAAGQAEARKNGWPVAIAIFDTAGQLVAFEKLDDTQTASVQVAQDKGRAAVIYRRPTKVFEDLVAGGGAGTRILGLRDASPVEGGLPIMAGGKVIGGIGVSGVTSQQDGIVAKAGADALK